MSQSFEGMATDHLALQQLPLGLFGSVMGVTGLSVAWRLAHTQYGVPVGISIAIAGVAVTAFLLMVAGYTVKLIAAFPAARDELRHPSDGNHFGNVLISLLQLPVVVEPLAHQLAEITWLAGTGGTVCFTWLVVTRWITHRHQLVDITPAWMIPAITVLNVPLAIPALGLPHLHALMVAALAIGLFFGVLLFALLFSRLLFSPPLPPALEPTLLTVLAPFAVGYSAYTLTTGRTDVFAESLLSLALFLLAVLIGTLRHLPACCPLRFSWWSVSFPLAACSVATLRFAAARPSVVSNAIAAILLTLATLVIARLLVSTLAIVRIRSLSEAARLE